MSTTMDSWSRFRVHAVIFHQVSVPLNSQPVFVSVCLSVSFYGLVRAPGRTDRQPHNTRIRHTHSRAEEDEDKRDREATEK